MTSATPPHRLVVNAIGDADLCAGDLDAAEKFCSTVEGPVINPPAGQSDGQGGKRPAPN